MMNVREPWELHDTLAICQNLYGSEPAAGFFTTFGAFAANERHLFFKLRSIGNVHMSYNNQSAVDRADFVFHAFSIGVRFFAPCTPILVDGTSPGAGNVVIPAPYQAWWLHTLPRHCGFEFSVGQDVKLSANSLMAAPGYGPDVSAIGAGVDGHAIIDYEEGSFVYQDPVIPEIIWSGTQGVPQKQFRFQFGDARNPSPIAIPRGEIIEARILLSQYAQRVLQQFSEADPQSYVLQQDMGEPAQGWITFPARFGIQVSLYGMREVQQRGQLHV
jgi:hypothetical protein